MADESYISLDAPTAAEPDQLDRTYTAPARTFKGRALHPYSHGIDLLHAQVTEFGNDTQFYYVVSFLFLLLVRDPGLSPVEDRKRHVLPLAWNVQDFRAALVEWLDEVKWIPADFEEATRLMQELRSEVEAAAVEIVGGRKKKPAARSPRKRRSS